MGFHEASEVQVEEGEGTSAFFVFCMDDSRGIFLTAVMDFSQKDWKSSWRSKGGRFMKYLSKFTRAMFLSVKEIMKESVVVVKQSVKQAAHGSGEQNDEESHGQKGKGTFKQVENYGLPCEAVPPVTVYPSGNQEEDEGRQNEERAVPDEKVEGMSPGQGEVT
jgi:hypothetical protein